MNYADFTKKLVLPPDFEAPRRLTYEGLVAEALDRSHLEDDVRVELLSRDVDASWWVTPEAYERGHYAKLYVALQHWLTEEFPFGAVHYSRTSASQRRPRSSMPEDATCASPTPTTQMGWEVEDIEATVRELRSCGVVFEEYDMPGLKTVDGIAEIEGNYPSKGTGERGAWFRDSEGNMLGIGQPVGN